MSHFCTKCGMELREEAVFCPRCGQRTAAYSERWNEFGIFLAQNCLLLAGNLLKLLLGGAVFACGTSGLCLLILGALLFYHFASAGVWVLPAEAAVRVGVQSIGGVWLPASGIAAIFIGLLFGLAAVSLCRLIKR